jgi:hypothetical protein
VDAHTFTKQAEKVKTKVGQKADGNCFLRYGRSADGGIHATRDHNNVRSVLRNTKKQCRANQGKRRGMMASGVMFLQDNARPHTAARTRALLEHFKWELFDHPLYSSDLAASDYDQFTRTYLKNWFRSQRFNSNKELMGSNKTWLSSQAAGFLDTGIQKLIPL